MRNNIFVIGYPRSGTTWLCRLIADAWNCPIGTIHNKDIFHGHPAEGKDRTGPFVVLHGHSPPERVEKKDADFCFFVYRDPRDVIVSISHYFDTPLDEAINDAINGRPDADGPRRYPIADYVNNWMQSSIFDYAVRYEMLHADASLVLCDIEEVLDVKMVNDIWQVMERQEFLTRRAGPAHDRAYHERHMRKGIIGDWINHFTVEQLARVQQMDGLGYW